MSMVNVAEMSPAVREAFIIAGSAIDAWDVKAHEILEDCIQNNKRVLIDITKRRVAEEILTGVISAFLIDLIPIFIIYLSKADTSSFAVKGRLLCLIFIVLSGILVAIHWKRKILRLTQEGAEWRTNINKLIELTGALPHDERQQLYAVMLALGIEVQQGKRNAELIRAAYNGGWTDGFSIGRNQ